MATRISVEVSVEAAEAFESSSPEERQDLARIIEHHLVRRRASLKEFSELAQRVGEYAKGQGLTEEKLDELLADES